ncbi:Glucose-6-phosphate isomerase B [Novipirellula aureliae]|uniref:Glucose-6-phosphate isomerase B n=1 Tax=Novipirellula aureliae TaxID=2527966 RepID=A0A5C6DBQ5_9BACT|nr:glucose-6-phosphate isomerase [Novipirellula aureliae]TWU33625.1 Glucose-6-phosphate isomerase B [Novipirellula aureliae]
MSLLRFDPSGALTGDYGVPEHQFAEAAIAFEKIRSEMANANRFPCDNMPLAPKHARCIQTPFFRLPETELADYVARREESLLGRIFKVANSIDAKIDAVVILGNRATIRNIKAITNASCEPYHNELSRAERGSRPRLYFAGDNFDNDALSALIRRQSIGGYVDTLPERRFAVIAIDRDEGNGQVGEALRHCIKTFERAETTVSPQHEPEFPLSEALIPILGDRTKLRSLANHIGCSEIYEIADGVDDWFSALSSVTLMPTALLGLDCMRLLEGAARMNEHFLAAPFSENVVLQYTAINHLVGRGRTGSLRAMNVWVNALQSTAEWYQGLLTKHLPMVTPLSWAFQRETPKRNDLIVNHVAVDSWRTDALPRNEPDCQQDERYTLADRTKQAIAEAQLQAAATGQPTTLLTLPLIDSDTIGQLLQMLMISAAIEMHLLHLDGEADFASVAGKLSDADT